MSQEQATASNLLHISSFGGDKQATPPPAKKQPKTKPSRYLPTERVTINKQFDLLRAYVAASGHENKPVKVNDVASVVAMNPSTISMVNPFLIDAKFLHRTEGGIIPSTEVQNYAKTYEWDKERANEELAPIVENSWFYQELKGKLAFRAIEEAEAITDLAKAVNASTDYKTNLTLLIDYMEAAKVIQRDGSRIKAIRVNGAEKQLSVEKQQPAMSESQPQKEREQSQPKPQNTTSFMQPAQGVIQFHVSVKVDMTEFAGWSPERIQAFFAGVAQVLAAKNSGDSEE